MTRNRRDQLLQSLAHHSEPVIVVDNASTDGSPEAVEEKFPDVQVIRLPRNRGAAARNIGVAAARTPYVAFADDDSWWAPGALEAAARTLRRRPTLALVAARTLVGPEQRLDPVCTAMAESPLPELPDVGGRVVVGFVACATVVRRDAFLDVGGFDEVVFFPGEEERVALDLTCAGWELAFVPSVTAHHHPEERTDGTARLRLLRRNAVLTAVMRHPWPVVVDRTLTALRAEHGVAVLGDVVRRLPAALRARRRIPEHVDKTWRAAGAS